MRTSPGAPFDTRSSQTSEVAFDIPYAESARAGTLGPPASRQGPVGRTRPPDAILPSVDVYLVDGTYELFRHFFALPPKLLKDGTDIAATRGVLRSLLGMIEEGATHLGVATDQTIRSFRNDLWPDYKSELGVDPRLLNQFPLLEEGIAALGIALWPMRELEADDGLAAAARRCAEEPDVARVYICTPDKDLAQCVRGSRVVQMDRRTRKITDEQGVLAKFGVLPESIPDYLALVGDSSDGYPGLPGWGPTSAGAALLTYGHLELLPSDPAGWKTSIRGLGKLLATLEEQRDRAFLFRDLATLRDDARLFASTADLLWRGPKPELRSFGERIAAGELWERAQALAARSVD